MTMLDLPDHFAALEDPRQSWKTLCPLDEILLIVLAGVMAGADDFVEISLWARRKLAWLRRFLPFEHGVPSHDTLNDVMNARACVICSPSASRTGWPACARMTPISWPSTARPRAARTGRMAARCTWSRPGRRASGRSLGQERCATKENEISAIPRLLERLELRGALVTIDAMGCQHGIADTILKRGADYLLALKGNQKSLHAEVAMYFDQATDLACHETTDADHGRIETRRAWVSHDVDWLRPDRAEPGLHRFPGLKAIGMVEATVEHKGQTSVARRCFLSSAPLSAAALLHATRAHWGVENRLHWVMDVVFHDDLMQLRTQNGPANMALIRHTALNIFKNTTSKISLKNRRKLAAWDDAYLFSTITGHQ